MTSPLESRDSYPHPEILRTGMSLPATGNSELDELLMQRNEADARILATLIQGVLSSPGGRAVIMAALPADEIKSIARQVAKEAAREAINTTPVPNHEHRAKDVVVATTIRGLSRIGALVGGLVGGLVGWLLVSNYSVTTITFGTPGQMHSASVAWIQAAIVTITVLFFAIFGALVGPGKKQRERLTHVNVTLESAHAHRGRVPSYGEIAATARSTRKEDS